MYSGKLVFAQVLEHVPPQSFRRCVQCYQGDRYGIMQLLRLLVEVASMPDLVPDRIFRVPQKSLAGSSAQLIG
jgi:hypothetical protein